MYPILIQFFFSIKNQSLLMKLPEEESIRLSLLNWTAWNNGVACTWIHCTQQNSIITIIKLDSAEKGGAMQSNSPQIITSHAYSPQSVGCGVFSSASSTAVCSLVRSKEEMSHGLALLLWFTDWMHSSTKYELPR